MTINCFLCIFAVSEGTTRYYPAGSAFIQTWGTGWRDGAGNIALYLTISPSRHSYLSNWGAQEETLVKINGKKTCKFSNRLLPDCIRAGVVSGLRGRRSKNNPLIPFRSNRSTFFFKNVQTDSGVHWASYSVGTGGSFSLGNAAGVWLTTHVRIVPSFRITGTITTTPPYTFVACTAKTWPNPISYHMIYSIQL